MALFKTGTWWDTVQSQINALVEARLDAERAAENEPSLQEELVKMEDQRADALGGKDEPASVA